MAEEDFGPVSVRYTDNVAVLQMKNDENRLNAQFLTYMNNALDAVLQKDDVVALVTTGEGKFYSNGIDLAWVAQQDIETTLKFERQLHTLISRVVTFPLPTVAALNGHAFAGGAFLAFAHDFRVMNTKRGWICANEVHIKIPIGEFLLELIRSKLASGPQQTELAVLGKRFTAADALAFNFVKAICVPEDLIRTSIKVAKHTIPRGGYDRAMLQQMKKDLYANVLAKAGVTHQIQVNSAKL